MNDNLLSRIARGITSTEDYCFGCNRLSLSDDSDMKYGIWMCNKQYGYGPVGQIGRVHSDMPLICDGPWRLCDGEWEYERS